MTKEIRLLHDTIWVYSKLRYNAFVSGGEKVQILVTETLSGGVLLSTCCAA